MENLRLWPEDVPGEFQPYLIPYLLSGDAVRPAIIVVPGGGYVCRADDHEGHQIAKRFNAMGYHTLILEYRVAPQAHYPEDQLDALRAIQLVRFNAGKWHIAPDKIGILGFSAGGHLASSTTYCCRRLQVKAGDEADLVSSRPDFTVLCYPVISGVTEPHYGSFINLLGKEAPENPDCAPLSGELQVDETTPPAFIWHTATDDCVPVANSINYARALWKQGIMCALHIYPKGCHGLGLAADQEDISRWPEECDIFLHRLGMSGK